MAFSVIDPARFGLNYEIALSDDEAALLQAENAGEMAVFLIAYKPQSGAEPGASINANLNGQIVLNIRTRIGIQKVRVGLEAGITLKNKV